MGRQGSGTDFGSWNFESNINPEELFRKIFGEAGFSSGAFGERLRETDYSANQQGFAAAEEVLVIVMHCMYLAVIKLFNTSYNILYIYEITIARAQSALLLAFEVLTYISSSTCCNLIFRKGFYT